MWIKKIFYRLIVCAISAMLVGALPAHASNIPAPGGVDESGDWMTPDNMQTFGDNLKGDLDQFQSGFQKQLVGNYVPIEAKVGTVFINALASVGNILDRTLGNFAIIFMIIMFAFWTSLEAYQIATARADTKNLHTTL